MPTEKPDCTVMCDIYERRQTYLLVIIDYWIEGRIPDPGCLFDQYDKFEHKDHNYKIIKIIN